MEDEDWTDFATSDFGSTAVDLWSDVVPLEPSADEGEQPGLTRDPHGRDAEGALHRGHQALGSNRHMHSLLGPIVREESVRP